MRFCWFVLLGVAACSPTIDNVAHDRDWNEHPYGSVRMSLPEGDPIDKRFDLTIGGQLVHEQMVGRRLETRFAGRLYVGSSAMTLDAGEFPVVDAAFLREVEAGFRKAAQAKNGTIVRFAPLTLGGLAGAEVEWTEPSGDGELRGLLRLATGERTLYFATVVRRSSTKHESLGRPQWDVADRFFRSIAINDRAGHGASSSLRGLMTFASASRAAL